MIAVALGKHMRKSRFLILRLCILIVSLVGALTFSAYQISRSHTYQFVGDIIARGPSDQPRIALTFDDGPSLAYTQDVLDILTAHDVPATFFLVGHDMVKHPAETHAIVAAGHEVGNHSYTHQRLVLMSRAAIRHELEQTDAVIRAAGYTGPIQFRPPFGKKLINLPRVLKEQGRASVMWSSAPEGAVQHDKDEVVQIEALVKVAVQTAEAGEIILLHPMFKSRAATRAALPTMIEGLKARGFELVRLSDLLMPEPAKP
jgi:peptidoglycan/xylan/chitin deacetylase (PgdA/CDA1 family)